MTDDRRADLWNEPWTGTTEEWRAILDELADARRRAESLDKAHASALRVIADHNLCHDLHGKVGAKEFAEGCTQEQRKLFGCAPTADALVVAEKRVSDLTAELAEEKKRMRERCAVVADEQAWKHGGKFFDAPEMNSVAIAAAIRALPDDPQQ